MDVTVSAQEHMFIFFILICLQLKFKMLKMAAFFFLVIPFMKWKMTIRNQICLAAF